MAILCDRNAIEIKRYGHPMGFPKTPKMALIQAVCGRGEWGGVSGVGVSGAGVSGVGVSGVG